MDFQFSEEEDLLRKTLRQFAKQELLPNYAARESPDYDVSDLLRKMAALGLLGLRAPAEYGGSEASCTTVGVAVEECARGDYSAGSVIIGNNISTELIGNHGSAEVKTEWLPEVIKGRVRVGVALTEPHCGSDAAAMQTRAVREGDEYVLVGEKSSISWLDAEGCIVFARTSAGTGARGISAFLVPLDAPGVGRSFCRDLGMKLSRRGSLHFDQVRVPLDNLIGEEGQGFRIIMKEFDYSRAVIALQCIGTAMQSVDDTVEYVKTRTAFGQPIARFQGVSFPIAEAATRLEAARLLCYKALWLRDNGLAHNKEAAMVKWLGPKLAGETIHQMLLLHGHAGYGDDYPLGQRLRDVIGHQIGDGTAEVMKLIMARQILGREFAPV